MREKLREGSDQAASALGRHVAAGRDLVESADPQRCIASMRANDVVDRYFARTYLVDAAGPGQDQFVHWHSNKLSVVGLSPAHPLVAQARARLAEAGPGAKGPADASPGGLPPALQAVLAGREAVAVPDDSCQASVAEGRFIKRIEYKVGAKRPTGKRKKGAESLAPGSTLCVVTDTAGQQHPVVACGRPAAWRVALPLPPNRSHPRSQGHALQRARDQQSPPRQPRPPGHARACRGCCPTARMDVADRAGCMRPSAHSFRRRGSPRPWALSPSPGSR